MYTFFYSPDILFNIFINDLFFHFCSDNLHNLEDDNKISAVSQALQGLIESIQAQTERAIDWMDNNYMVANPEKFKSIITTKDRQETSGINFEFSGKMIKSRTKVIRIRISIDMKLSFDHHVSESESAFT